MASESLGDGSGLWPIVLFVDSWADFDGRALFREGVLIRIPRLARNDGPILS